MRQIVTALCRRTRMRQLPLACLLLVIAACSSPGVSAGNGPPRTPLPYSGPICVSVQCAAHSVQVFVEPDAGEAPVLRAIKGAATSVWVEVYEMTDTAVKHALEDVANRGVDVRVLLEPHPFGGGDVQAQQTLEELAASGVHAEASDPAFTYTHAKLLLVDGVIAYILE
jgi:phosphatidylserine/phosphatidylglycerophosphate/cardiolipin synthase-like enzyme